MRPARPAFGSAFRVEPLERRALLDANINGTVFDDRNGNGVRDGGEPGLANQRVFIDVNFDGVRNTGEPSVLTNSTGAYTFVNRPTGIHRVRYEVPGGRRLTAPALIFYDVTVIFTTINNRNFASTTTGVIRGTVFEDGNGNGRRDGIERGLSGWTVFLDKDNDGKFDAGEKSRVTNSRGEYRFAGLTPGTYFVRVVQQSGFTRTNPLNGLFRVTLAAAQGVSNRNFAEDPIG
jgi:hypothetical protein